MTAVAEKVDNMVLFAGLVGAARVRWLMFKVSNVFTEALLVKLSAPGQLVEDGVHRVQSFGRDGAGLLLLLTVVFLFFWNKQQGLSYAYFFESTCFSHLMIKKAVANVAERKQKALIEHIKSLPEYYPTTRHPRNGT